MNSKIFYMNIFLVCIIMALSVIVVQLWTSKGLTINSIAPQDYKANKAYEKRQVLKKQPSMISTYSDVVNKNLFSPKREAFIPEPIADIPDEIIPEPEKIEPVLEEIPPLDTNRIKLYGVLILNQNYKKALVSNVDRKNNRPSIWVRIGDTVGNFSVDTIYKDKIIVRNGDKKFSIFLNDAQKNRSTVILDKKDTSPKPAKKINVKNLNPIPTKKKINSSEDEFEYIQTPFGKHKIKKTK